MLGLPPAEEGGVQWHIAKLRALREEMNQEDLVCPMVWIPKWVAEDICPNKLLDLFNFAPSDWDSIVCAIVIVSRGVLLGEKNYEDAEAALTECRSAMSRPQGAAAANADPLLLRYHAAMAHIVDATWVMAACLHRGLSVRAVLDSMQSSIPRVRSLGVRDQAAVAALRSLCLQIVHYTLWPSLMDERKPVFKEAMQSATCAMALAPDEGVWLTLYARCLPWSDSRKSILLQAGFNLNKTPFTVIEYATYLSHSGYAEAVDEAAKLCELAIRMWPESVFVNANYVTLFLNSNCRAKLSLATADECLRRARSLAPDSPMLAGHRWNLRDVHRAGGHLSPILEEGEDVLADVGGWSPEKEQRLLAIAACLYPSAMQQLQRLAHPVQQPGAAGAAEGAVRPDDSPKGPDTLWSPRMQKKFASPGGRSSPPSPGPSPDPAPLHLTSVPDPSSVEHDPSLPSNFTRPPTTIPPPTPSPSPPPTLSPSPHPTPSPSPPPSLSPTSSPPPTRLPGKPLRMRTSPISGPLRRPRTSPAARPVDAHSGVSSSSPAGTPVTPPCVNTGTSAPPPCPTPCVPLPPPEFRDAPVADPVAAAPKVSPCAPSRRSWGFPAQSPPPEAFARAKTSSPATARPAAPAQSPPPEAFARAKTSSPATARPAAPVKPPAPVIAVPVSQGVPAPVTVHQDFSDAVTEPSVVKDLRAAVCEPSVAQDLSPAPLMQCAPAVQDLRASVTQPCVQQDLSGAINEVSAAQDLPSATFSTPSSPVSPIVPPANVKRQRVPEGAPPLTELIPPSYFEAPQHGPPADVKPDSRLSAVELLDPAPPLRVEPASVPLPEEKTAIHFEAPPMAVSKAQARLERLVAALSSPPCKAEHGPPAGVKPDLVPPLKVEPVSVSPPESKTARSGAAPQGRLSPESVHASGGNGAPGWHKSSLRPTAPAWVPPSMRPARPASGLMPPSRPRHGGCMRPVALPTPPPSPASESAWSDFLVAQSLIQPPMEYKCPAQERFKRLKLQEPKEVKSEVQVKLGDTARDCEDYHWQAKLFDLHHTGNPAPMTNGNHCPVKLEVPSKCEHKGKNLDGFITPPFMEGAYDARKEIVLRTEKDECRSDMKRIASSARVNLNDKFSQVKTEVTASEHTKAVTISAPASRPVILICDDKSMSTIPNDLCPSNRSDSQAGVAPACPQSGESSEQPCTNASGNSNPARIRSPGPFARAAAAPGPFARAAADIGLFGPAPSRVRHASSAATSNSAQKPGLTSSERPQQVTRVVYTNCGWTNQQKPSVVAAPVSSYGQTNQQKPSVVAAPVSSCGQTNQQKPSVVAAPVSSCGQTNQRMPSVAAPVTSGWRSFVVAPMPSGVGVAPLRGFATPTSSLGPQPLMSMPTISFGPQPLMSVFVPAPPLPSYVMPVPAPAPAPNFASNSARHPAPNHWAPRQASNFAAAPPSMNFSAPRPASNFAAAPPSMNFSAPRPASNFAAAPPSMNFSAPRPASNFAAAPPSMNFSAPRPASNFAASPSGSNFSTPPVANVAAPPAASSRCAAPPAASSRCASPPAASDVEASRRSVCADALAEVRGLIEEADACPRPQSPAWETVKSRRPHLAQPAGSARSRTSSPAGRFSVLSKASPTSSGHSSRATSPVRADGKADDVPLWRRGGGDADRGHWFTPSTPNPTTPSCSSTQLEPPVALRPEPVRTVPPAAALPACNCVCSSDCVSATYKYYGDLRPGPQVEKRCLKKGLLNGAPRPRLSSRLVIS